jgi:hypothetical protein
VNRNREMTLSACVEMGMPEVPHYTTLAYATDWSDWLEVGDAKYRRRLVVLPCLVRLEEEECERHPVEASELCIALPVPTTVGRFLELCSAIDVPSPLVRSDLQP